MPIYALEGEIVTCASGHPMFRLRQDVFVGEICRAEMLEPLDDRLHPTDGKPIETCPKCDEVCGRWNMLHFGESEWRIAGRKGTRIADA